MSKRRAPPQKLVDKTDGHRVAALDAHDPWATSEMREALRQAAFTARADAVELRDGFKNELTGIGDFLRDKTMGGKPNGPDFLVWPMLGVEVEARWRGSDLGARIVETIPAQMVRCGFEVVVQPDEDEKEPDDEVEEASVEGEPVEEEEEEDKPAEGEERDDFVPSKGPPKPGAAGPPGMPGMMPPAEKKPKPLPDLDGGGAEIAEDTEAALNELDVTEKFREALCYERAYGGAAILIGADDGFSELTKPLSEETVKSVDYLNVFTGGWDGECVAWSYYNDPRKANYGKPEIYCIRNIGVALTASPAPGQKAQFNANAVPSVFYVHESRLLVFPGTAASRSIRNQMRGWGDSIFTRVNEVLSQFNQTWGGVANLMTDFSQGVLMISGLLENMATRGKDNAKGSGLGSLATRAQAIQLTKAISRILLVDKDKEDFKRDTVSVGGVAEVLQQFCLRLAAAADMPVTLLMGQAPAGLGATGASDIRFFYDRAQAEQKQRMKPNLIRLIRLLFLAKEGPTKGKEPAKWDVKFNSLYQRTELEEAQLRKTVADTDKIYCDLGTYSAEEVGASAFAGAGWTMERTLDLAGREKMAELDEKEKGEREAKMLEAAKGEPAMPIQEEAKPPAVIAIAPPSKDQMDAMLDELLSSEVVVEPVPAREPAPVEEVVPSIAPEPAVAPPLDPIQAVAAIINNAKEARLAGMEIDVSGQLAEHGVKITGRVD